MVHSDGADRQVAMTSTSAELKGSAALLTAANIVCAVIGVSQGLLVLRMLGPESFGAAAVLVALAAVAANVIDVRPIDLISGLYYGKPASCPQSGEAYRVAALRLGVRLYGLSAVLIVIGACCLALFAAHKFTAVDILTSSLLAAAAAQGVSYFGSFFIFVQRFIAPARRLAYLQFASALINAAAMVMCVAASRTIGGYAIGLLVSACGIAGVNALYTMSILRQRRMVLFGRPLSPLPQIDRDVVIKFISAGNLLGYVKLLHRSADVLLVAAFCNDRGTGVYKLARSVADGFLVISEAVGRVYQPQLLRLLQTGNLEEYGRIARALMAMAAAVTLAGVAAEIPLVPYLAPFVGVADAEGLTSSVVILTITFFFVAGLQSWISPMFVFSGRLGRCTLWGAVGVVAGQYTIGPALVYLTGDANPAWFSLGFLGFYVVSLPPLWREIRREGSIPMWTAGEVVPL
jgi:O-antigen/teichoic acid export membrane protein